MTNHCIYDCAYCLNRRSNDRPRAAFTVDELVTLTMNFYRRNYIEGLFLSSAIIGSADYTMELLVKVVETLRYQHKFHGYIHLKAIPGANPLLIQRAGQVADRLSVNMELPSEKSLALLAPERKNRLSCCLCSKSSRELPNKNRNGLYPKKRLPLCGRTNHSNDCGGFAGKTICRFYGYLPHCIRNFL